MLTMNKISVKRCIRASLVVAALLLSACAQTKSLDVKPTMESKNPTELVNSFDSEIANARKNELNVLSPAWFAKAEVSLKEAKRVLGTGKEISKILESVTQGRAHLQTAEEMAEVARTTLPDVIKGRKLARAAGATNLDDYAGVEQQFLRLTEAIENNNLRYAQKNRAKVNEAFRQLELRAIKVQTIGEVRKLISQAEEEGAKKFAPKTLAAAQQKLNAVDAFITENPYEKEKMPQMAGDALFNARRALQVTRQSEKIRPMNPEETALWMEDVLHKMVSQLNASDMRDESFDTQIENILGSIRALQEDHAFTIAKVKNLQAEGEDLNRQIAALRGTAMEEKTEKERLAAERRFNQKFIEVQNYFEPGEAEVYKQGYQLVIRLRGIQFPVGKDVIMPNNYPLLSKVQRTIHTFDKPKVVIEGHTDSTGPEEVNEHLSQKRAESVRSYLIANRTLPSEDIVAVGYGSIRPLASNATAEGRAINRRIDVIVKAPAPR